MNELFINAAILISWITLGNLFLREKGTDYLTPTGEKIVIGFFSGVLGCILMLYGIKVSPEIILDFRYIPIIICALYVGPASAIIAALVIGLFRMFYLGLSLSSAIAVVVLFLIGLGCSIIGRLSLKSWLKWVCCNVFANVFIILTILLLLGFSPGHYHVLMVYGLWTVLISSAMYYLSKYLKSSNLHYYKMKEESSKDFLTGLYNVSQFAKLSDRILQEARAIESPVSLLFMDIDYFKNVNDFYGHLAGDAILKELGMILTVTSRKRDLVSRNGGEEFTVLLPDCPLKEAIEVAERIRENVAMHEFKLSSGKKIQITVSIGIASFPDTTDKIENLIEQADIALYHAKWAGRNQVMVANQKKR